MGILIVLFVIFFGPILWAAYYTFRNPETLKTSWVLHLTLFLWAIAGTFFIYLVKKDYDHSKFPYFEKGRKIAIPISQVTVERHYYNGDKDAGGRQWNGRDYLLIATGIDSLTNKTVTFSKIVYFDPNPWLKKLDKLDVYVNPDDLEGFEFDMRRHQ